MSAPQLDQHDGLNWLLEDFIRKIGHDARAVLASRDGLPRAYAGTSWDEAGPIAARTSSLNSLQKNIGADVDGEEEPVVVQNVGEVQVGRIRLLEFVMVAGQGTLLAVRTSGDADLRTVGFEMTELVKRVDQHLATPDRQPVATGAVGQ